MSLAQLEEQYPSKLSAEGSSPSRHNTNNRKRKFLLKGASASQELFSNSCDFKCK